ncbi:uncharacterized protein LOC111090394 isoform X3 [Canis lupus familiaris]|uniref:uncharacterized protein LOC111090394 isoform X3 n=1 Tax=Canis lupus familiaris TaxID=9615 RepID=UPI0018F78138|nr:uncharacterized protein LOC111090394 isoform X3 [Canis lupus familiaris]XP_038418324.1 uncharacterized protein LOC111090394 isoform X2 [Canis lupus familiaris]
MHGAKGGPARGTLISGVPPTQILAPPGPSWPLLLAVSCPRSWPLPPKRAATGRPTSCRLHFVQTARYCAHDSERWGSTKVVLNPERSQHDVTGSGSPAYPDVTSERRAAPRRAAGRRSLSTRDVLRAGSSRSRACGLWWPDILTSGPRNTYLDVLLKIPEQLESRQEQVTKSRRLITFCYLINLVRKLGNLLHVSRCPRHCIAPCGLQKVQPRMALCGVWHPPPQRGLHLPAMWFEKVVSHCCFDLHFLDYWLSYNLQ